MATPVERKQRIIEVAAAMAADGWQWVDGVLVQVKR